MIRAGRGGVYAADWLERGIVGIGWDFGGADIAGMNREKIRAAYAAAHPSESKQKVAANVGQIYRFAHCMAQGSTVVMYDPAERLYHIGDISGPCKPTSESESLTYTRTVKWGKTALRDALSPASKNSLGGIQTIFAVSDEVMSDLEAAGSKPACNDSSADADDNAANDEETLAATYDNGIELIKDRVNQLDWEDMERLVAGMLEAMGYCARVMPKGPDGGRDVVASPDALGLESPRIVAEEKEERARKTAMDDFNAAFSEYLKALGNSELTVEKIDELENAISALSGSEKGCTIEIESEQFKSLVKSVRDYTERLSKANSAKSSNVVFKLFEKKPSDISGLKECLATQREILTQAA